MLRLSSVVSRRVSNRLLAPATALSTEIIAIKANLSSPTYLLAGSKRSMFTKFTAKKATPGNLFNSPAPAAGPSEKTTILLQRLPLGATEGNLRDAVVDVKCRKVQLEPGCAVHVLNEAEADFSVAQVKQKLGLTVSECVIFNYATPHQPLFSALF